MAASYYNHYSWGYTYYDTNTNVESLYYYKIKSLTVSRDTNTIPYDTYTKIYIKPVVESHIDPFTGKEYTGKIASVNIKSSKPSYVSVVRSSCAGNITTNTSSDNFSFKLYNKNTTPQKNYSLINVTAYTLANGLTTKGDKLSRKFLQYADGAPKQQSYYTYGPQSYSYFNADTNKVTVYNYNINSISTSLSTSSPISYYGSVKLTTSVNLSHSAARVNRVEYKILSPYYLSLTQNKLTVNGTTPTAGTITLFNYNQTSKSQTGTVAITAYCGEIYKTINKQIQLNAKPYTGPQILSHNINAATSIAFDGYTNVYGTVKLNNDKIVSCTTYMSTSSQYAYMNVNNLSASSMGTWGISSSSQYLGVIKTRPEVPHSAKTTVRVVNTIKTAYGLTSTAYCDIKVDATNMDEYNAYYAPKIESVTISRTPTIIEHNGSSTLKLNVVVVRDTVSSVSWSTSPLYASISASGQTAIVKGHNTTTVTKAIPITVKITTKKGLVYQGNTVITIKGVPVIEPEEIEKPKLTIDEARENILAYLNSQFDLLNS